MIVQIKGNIKFPITLDPSVWIFDDRKLLLEELFEERKHKDDKNDAQKTAEMFDQELYFNTKIKPPVNQSIQRFDRNKILSESFVMPLESFIKNVEPNSDATSARLVTDGDDIIISLEQLQNAHALFSHEGKQLKEDGPIHLYFGDGSNKDKPFKNIKQIVIE